MDAPSSGRTMPKSKRGCLTCKARKVKCDEIRPACRRCTLTGRTCGGYGVWGGGSIISASTHQQTAIRKQAGINEVPNSPFDLISPPKALGIRHVSRPEQECFDWFLRRSCVKLPGLNIPEFWKSTLLQASTTEPPVMHAVLALGSLHQRDAGETIQGWQTSKLETFMLRQYSQALHHLQLLSNQTSSEALSVTLTAAVVFVYFEFLRSNYHTGCTHLHFLLLLLDQAEESIAFKRTSSSYRWILEPILRLYIQAQLVGQLSISLPAVFQQAAFEPLPAIFNSLHHGRWYLDLLVAETLHLQYLRHRQQSSGDEHQDACLTITSTANNRTMKSANMIQSQLNIWHTSFAATMTAIAPKATPRDHFRYAASCNFQRMAVIMIDILLQSNVPTLADGPHMIDEETYDTHTHAFLQNLATAIEQWRVSSSPQIRAQILGATFLDRKPTEPTIDQGWLHHLFFTAVKCRVHRVRQHALRLMRTTWHKEGIWDTEWVVRVAEEVVRLEEEGFFHPEGEGQTPENNDDCYDGYGDGSHAASTSTSTSTTMSISTSSPLSATSVATTTTAPPEPLRNQCPCKFSLLSHPPYLYPFTDTTQTETHPANASAAADNLVTLPVERRLHGLKITLPEGNNGDGRMVLGLEFWRMNRGVGFGGGEGKDKWMWERREFIMGGPHRGVDRKERVIWRSVDR